MEAISGTHNCALKHALRFMDLVKEEAGVDLAVSGQGVSSDAAYAWMNVREEEREAVSRAVRLVGRMPRFRDVTATNLDPAVGMRMRYAGEGAGRALEGMKKFDPSRVLAVAYVEL